MGTASGNSTWQNSPSVATPITAARLEAIEGALDTIAASIAALPALADVATSGSYTDLTDTPTIPDGTQDINAQTGTTYTLVAGDAGDLVTCANAAAVTVTVPASVFTAGQRVDILAAGAGQVTLAAGAGMTLRTSSTLALRVQWSAASVMFTSATEAVVVGDMEAA